MFIHRLALNRLENLGKTFPVLAIVGPRQVGKTTLAKVFADRIPKPSLYLDLERPSDQQKLSEPELYLGEQLDRCVIIDEVQRLPVLFPVLRSLVDERRVPLRFVLLGSASPDLLRNTSESLAGRIAYVELSGFNRMEISQTLTLQDHHFRGGFPEAVLAPTLEEANVWLDNFILTYLERDLPTLGMPSAPATIRKLWEMLAWQNGRVVNYSNLARSLGHSSQSVNKYIDFLEGAFLVTRLRPFLLNIKKRLVKSPKILVRDSGILHRLLRLQNYDQLLGTPMVGASWETYTIEQIRNLKQDDVDLFFYRTHAGAEVDLVLVKGLQALSCIEIKLTATPSVSKSLSSCISDLGTTRNFIITPKSEDFPLRRDLRACSLERFLENHLPTF